VARWPDIAGTRHGRPIYHYLRESIEAHLSIVVAAMAVSLITFGLMPALSAPVA
jgi:hypothetical protein